MSNPNHERRIEFGPISGIFYDVGTGLTRVAWRKSGNYIAEIPEDKALDLLKAPNALTFFNAELRTQFPWRRLTPKEVHQLLDPKPRPWRN